MADEITKSDSRTIHEARVDGEGKPLCWHIPIRVEFQGATMPGVRGGCSECNVELDMDSKNIYTYNPDYSTNHAEYLKALNEFRKIGWWEDFKKFVAKKTDRFVTVMLIPDFMLNHVLGTPILADFLRGRKEDG